MTGKNVKIAGVLMAAVCGLVFSGKAQANLNMIKEYKIAYPDTKLKCIDCHTAALPKKDDGQHDWNDYGLAVKKAAGDQKPTADTFKAVGKIEDFKKQ